MLLWLLGNAVRDGVFACEDIVLAMPIIGNLYERIFQPTTYYKIDTMLMFQQTVHNAVLEIIDDENLMQNAEENGNYLMDEIKKIEHLTNVRGKGLMIGFDVPAELKDLKKNLLMKHKIFTGEAKPNIIRLLPSLALKKEDADKFLTALMDEVSTLSMQDARTVAS